MKRVDFLKVLNIFGSFYFLLGMVGVIYTGFMEDFYLSNIMGIPFSEQPYPFELITWLSGFMLTHIVLLNFLAKSFNTHPYIIIFLALIINFGFLSLIILGSMHSHLAWTVYAIWEVVLLALLIVFTIVSIFKKLTA